MQFEEKGFPKNVKIQINFNTKDTRFKQKISYRKITIIKPEKKKKNSNGTNRAL